MKKLTVFILAMFLALGCTGCRDNNTYKIKFTIPAGNRDLFIYAEEEICPTGDKITISASEGLEETEVILSTVNELLTPGYVATPLVPGMPIEFDTTKGEWLKVGIAVQNPTDTDKIVYINVEGAEVRIE